MREEGLNRDIEGTTSSYRKKLFLRRLNHEKSNK